MMNIQDMIEQIKKHPQTGKIGMITSHLGIVRGHSRNGKDVLAVRVAYDRKKINKIVREMNKKPGIVKVMVDINDGKVELGGELLAVVVAGDLREHVFPVLMETVNRIKASACQKQEILKQEELLKKG